MKSELKDRERYLIWITEDLEDCLLARYYLEKRSFQYGHSPRQTIKIDKVNRWVDIKQIYELLTK